MALKRLFYGIVQNVCTRSALAAVSEVIAAALLNKALYMRTKIAGELLHDVRAINAIKIILADSDILVGVLLIQSHDTS